MMRKWSVVCVSVIMVLGIMIAGCGGAKDASESAAKVELNVSAAVSMKDALAEIQKNYQAKYPNVTLVYNLGASGTLQKQIEEGAPADIFISAATKQMDDLEAKNLIDKATRKNLLDNKLVMIVPQNSTLVINKFEDLVKADVQKFCIGEPSVVPAGQYSKEALNKLGIWDGIKDKVVLAKDVRTVLTYVETGNVEAGLVYKTDAIVSDKVKIVASAPEGSHKPIVYPAAIMAGTKERKAAEDFFAYLTSPESVAVFEKYGFSMNK
ncbi:MAG: molybdenum transporter, periplasmic molybdate-binding protein [Firmicutes bacterium]|nr:molybdenum transporter, periplasmic molybdate-binding protein [Bacillota bacterium]